MKRTAVAILFAPLALAPIPPARSQAPSLQTHINSLVHAYPGHVALYARNLATGESVAVAAGTEVQTASVIKLSLMLQAYEQVKADRLSLSQPVTLTKDNQVPGSGILQYLTPGDRMPLHDAITLMITLSDNTATNMVIDAVGLAPTNAMLQHMGLRHTWFYKKVFRPATGPMPPDQAKFGLGKTTPREMAKLVESIYRCDIGRPDLCRDMINIMRRQQYRAMLPRYLPDGNASDGLPPIADKIGSLDAVRNDVALVYSKAGPLVISIFTYDNPDHSWTVDNHAEIFIARLAQAIVTAWSPAGLATTLPHLLARRGAN